MQQRRPTRIVSTLHVIADHPAYGGLSGGVSRMTLLLQTLGSLGVAQAVSTAL